MWYKEWVEVVKTRLIVQAITFGLIDLGYLLLYEVGWQRHGSDRAFFADWYIPATLMLIIFSLLFNVDIISREKNNNTLSFVVVRPIQRERIYISKLLINLTVSLGLFGVAVLPILTSDVASLGHNFSLLILSISLAVLMGCAGGLSSAMNRLNMGHSVKIGGSLTLFGTLGLLIILAVNYASGEHMYSNINSSEVSGNLGLSLVLFAISTVLYFIGRKAFNAVEV